ARRDGNSAHARRTLWRALRRLVRDSQLLRFARDAETCHRRAEWRRGRRMFRRLPALRCDEFGPTLCKAAAGRHPQQRYPQRLERAAASAIAQEPGAQGATLSASRLAKSGAEILDVDQRLRRTSEGKLVFRRLPPGDRIVLD